MNLKFIDLLPLLLFSILLIGIKPMRKTNTSYLSKDGGTALRGFFSIVIIFHHLAQSCSNVGLFFHHFTRVGELATSVFFFLSGYGLQKSYIASENYKNHFLQRRLSKILLPYFAITFLYWTLYAISGEFYTLSEVITAILSGSPIVTYSWYIICICYFYIAYWLFMHICKKNHSLMMICSCSWLLAYTILCKELGYGWWWYKTPHLLILGIFWAIHEQKILDIIKAHYQIIATLTFTSFLLAFITQIKFVNGLTGLVLTMISTFLFVLSTILFTLKIKIGNPILSFWGQISLELYLIHGLFIKGLRSDFVYIEHDFTWAITVIIGSIVSGFILHKAFSFVNEQQIISRLLRKLQTTFN